MQEKRENRTSLKMTDTVMDYVENYQGTSFNNKFENLVLYFKNAEADLDAKIKEREKRLKMLDDFIRERSELSSQMHGLQIQLRDLEDLFSKVKESCNDIIKTDEV